jgi:hypothetical protein
VFEVWVLELRLPLQRMELTVAMMPPLEFLWMV